jgi:D-alanyl-lipoteichoic acid acyltransferase DltB (MBOAT superfamily)
MMKANPAVLTPSPAEERATATGASSLNPLLSLSAFAALLVPLIFVAGLVHHFRLESPAFERLLWLSAAGFAVNYFLPQRHRLTFFLGLSFVAIGYLLDLRHALWIIGSGLALLGICHLPVAFRWRVVLLASTGVCLAVARVGSITGPWPAGMWPVLASMFMFRVVVYLYDLRHTPDLGSTRQRLAYFFLLPNVCFPLFPVVDYKAFCRGYYDRARDEIHLVGVRWIARGVLQLLLYRVVYQNLVNDPAAVTNAVELWQYLTWPFLLYLRVSGQFHVAIGILHLFGFNLPETHHSYYLASSFTDFWRRINIYWKDFMMKVFYYPAFFALRKRGGTFALVTSTMIVFVVTWALHAYQWFWLRGTVLFAWNDVLFWTILAVCVVVNSVVEFNRGRQRPVAGQGLPWGSAFARSLRATAMFCFISVLWSMWSTDSLGTWLALWPAALQLPDHAPSKAAMVCMAVPVLVWAAALVEARRAPSLPRAHYWRTATVTVAAVSVLVLVSTSRVYSMLGSAGGFVASVRFGGLNQADVEALERGYYENLLGADRLNGDLWALYMNRPVDWNNTLIEAGVARNLPGLVPYELLPNRSGRFKGVLLRTNRWGMHDKDYEREPPPGCLRVAILGASHTMGSGVRREDTFDARLEDRLNKGADGFSGCYELLNMAVYGYNPLVQLSVFENRVTGFKPRTVFYVGHPEDTRRVAKFLVSKIHEGTPVPFDDLNAMVREAGIDQNTPRRIVEQRLASLGPRVLAWFYQRFVAESRSAGICPVFVYMPMVPQLSYASEQAEIDLARQAGFTALDLRGVYEGMDRSTLWVAEWDAHPNARAHQLMADRLYDLLRRDPGLLECKAH